MSHGIAAAMGDAENARRIRLKVGACARSATHGVERGANLRDVGEETTSTCAPSASSIESILIVFMHTWLCVKRASMAAFSNSSFATQADTHGLNLWIMLIRHLFRVATYTRRGPTHILSAADVFSGELMLLALLMLIAAMA